MELERILTCTTLADDEPQVAQSLDIARLTGAEVLLLFASTIHEPRKDFSMPNEWDRALAMQLRADRERLEALRERLSGQGAKISHSVIDGVPHRAILRAARELKADLIAVGTHDYRGLQHFLLGSTAERVLRHAPVSVLLARPQTDNADGFSRILVPVDFSDVSERALEAAVSLCRPGGSVEVLHCWQLPSERLDVVLASDGGQEIVHAVRPELQRRAEEIGDQLCAQYKRDDIEIEFTTSEGPPRRVIHERLEAGGFDLVALGCKGHNAFERLLLGSVAENAARHAPCSALIVR